jgi:hypothetical protein
MKRRAQKSCIIEAAKAGSLPIGPHGGLHVNWKTLFQEAEPKGAITQFYTEIYSLNSQEAHVEEGAFKHNIINNWKGSVRDVLAAGVQEIYSTPGVSLCAEVKNVGGSVVTWDDSITFNSKSLAAGVQQIYSTRGDSVSAAREKVDGSVVTWDDNFARSSSFSAGVQQIYSTPGDAAGVQQSYSIRGHTFNAAGEKVDGSMVTWDDNFARNSSFSAGVQQIYSIRGDSVSAAGEKVDGNMVTWDDNFASNSSFSAGVQQINFTPGDAAGVQQIHSIRGDSVSAAGDKIDGSMVTWDNNFARNLSFSAGVQQIYSTPGDAAGVQQIYSTRKQGVTWGVNARGDVCLRSVPACENLELFDARKN